MRIIDKANEMPLQNMDIQTVKGTTKIELYNPNTRIKKVYKDENTFQSAVIAKYLHSHGIAKTNLSDYSWQNLVGGLLLFRDTITVGSKFMPEGNKMTGNGSYGVVNNSTPTEMGSYNSVESSASTSAITQVYDFTTSQANGDINCVCLTSATGGYVGYGNPSGTRVQDGALKSIVDTQNNTNFGGYFGYYNNISYGFAYEGTTLTIDKKYQPVSVGSVFDGMVKTQTIDVSQLSGYDSSFSVNGGRMAQSDGKMYFFPNITFNAGDTCTYLVYDYSTETAEFKTLTNSSGERFYVVNIGVSHGRVLIGQSSTGATWYLFDLATSTLLKTGIGVPYFSDYTDELSLLSNNGAYVYDGDNDTLYPTNGGSIKLAYDSNIDAWVNWYYHYGNFNNTSIYNASPYLATINNLNNTITKTAAQTMKVTYTLTEV